MDENIVIVITVAVAVIAFVVGLLFKKFRTLIGFLLVLIGAVASFTVMGAFVGVPILIVGAVILVLEYQGKRKEPDEE